jgi:hypothetical protein
MGVPLDWPSVFGRNLHLLQTGQRSELPRGMTLVTHVRLKRTLKRTCVGTNGILECRILSKNAHRARSAFTKSSIVSVSGPVCASVCSTRATTLPRSASRASPCSCNLSKSTCVSPSLQCLDGIYSGDGKR